jgi:hypothetical protein
MAHDALGDLHDAAARQVDDHQEAIRLHGAQQLNRFLCAGLLQFCRDGVVMRTRAHARQLLSCSADPVQIRIETRGETIGSGTSLGRAHSPWLTVVLTLRDEQVD